MFIMLTCQHFKSCVLSCTEHKVQLYLKGKSLDLLVLHDKSKLIQDACAHLADVISEAHLKFYSVYMQEDKSKIFKEIKSRPFGIMNAILMHIIVVGIKTKRQTLTSIFQPSITTARYQQGKMRQSFLFLCATYSKKLCEGGDVNLAFFVFIQFRPISIPEYYLTLFYVSSLLICVAYFLSLFFSDGLFLDPFSIACHEVKNISLIFLIRVSCFLLA